MTYQYIAESTLPADTPTYVTREADSQLYQSLLEGKLCYVFNSRKIGKSSLALQTIERLGKKGVRSVFIDLSSDETKLEHPEQWYANILDTLAYELKLEVDLKSWLQERNWLSPLRRFREFIELVMLSQVSEKIVIFFDEIDSVLSLNFSADDLFAFIRSCYNRRTQNAEYNRITFCLLGVATPSDLIQDKKRTPFNIGQAIELKGFTKEQAAPLAKGLEGKVNDPIQVLNEILDWTGGQPFLTQKLCKIVLEKAETCNPDIAELVQSYIINNWEANDNPEHIGTIRDRILSNQQRTSQLLGIYQQIITPPNPPLLRGGTDSTDSPLLSRAKDSTNSPLAEDKKNNLTPPLTKGGLGGVAADNSPDQMELQLSGLVVKRNGYLQVYNPIYAAIFNLDWVQQELAKLRPYQENFAAWIASNRQDTSRLLHGQALDDALQWKKGKRLSDEDNDFLDDSRDDERQKLRTSNKLLKEVRRQGMEVFKVEEAGRNALKLFHSGGKQIQALRIAIKAGKDLKKWIPDNPPPSEYPTITPLSALQIIIAKIRERRQFVGHNGKVNSVSFNPTGNAIATASDDKTAKLWNLQVNCLVTFTGHNNRVISVSFSPTGDSIATASFDGTAKLWDLQGNCLVTFTGHNYLLNSVSFSPKGDAIATASSDRTAKLWDLHGNCLVTFVGHNDSVTSVSFSPKGDAIATASHDGTAKLWNLEGKCLITFIEHRFPVNSVSFSPKGDAIATASSDDTAKLWELQDNYLATFAAHNDSVRSVSFSPTGDEMIATALDDKTAKFWDLQGNCLVTFIGHNDWVRSVSFSPNGDTIATASSDKTAKLWDLQGNCLATFTGHNDRVTSICFSPSGDAIATASQNKTAKLWDLQGNCLLTFTGHNDSVNSVSFNPEGDAIATASSDKTAKLWALQGNCLVTFTGHNDRVTSICFSPTGDAIATTSKDKTAKLWDLQGNCLVTFTGHNDSVWSVSFSPTGDTIATASQDGTAKLWDLQGNLLAEFSGYQGNLLKGEADFVELKTPIYSICFSRDGKFLITGSQDGKVRFWPVESLDELLARGREWLGDKF
ncbi:AAA-like domain-containing protein [Microcoleus sp. PH2017_02_FOX_O_A]|uniref:AAA-like domain-containing protein n=1 Tax=Microcoleus sp. PH2017_02_FOX_O_A TaxID=2798813 RepID=UPI001D72B5F1|nr:AAA-like domain-containing protein [Microcoleus sp. PH2017_02_FOX_O_A]MCC3413580.1 AAA-like domain-containing protein [Microcoleus sp. PH2017_02_FOX_O_A]